MLSILQEKKLTHLFNILDKDKNNILQRNDFVHLGENICKSLNWETGSENYENIMAKCEHIYTEIFNYIPHREQDNITLDLWLHYFDFALSMDEDIIIVDILDLFCNKVFEMFDQNQDGMITKAEYVDMFAIYGLNITDTPKTFELLDTDRDDMINKQELQKGLRDYFVSSDPEARGNWTFGKLE